MSIVDLKKSSVLNYSDDGEADANETCEDCGAELDSQQMCPNCDSEIDDLEETKFEDDFNEEEDEQ